MDGCPEFNPQYNATASEKYHFHELARQSLIDKVTMLFVSIQNHI
jgi:hypothetical protein